MNITRKQILKIIKEEYNAVMNETDDLFGERAYDHSLVSNVSKTLQWEIDQAFNFILDLLEDVNAHGEYDAVKKVFSSSIDMGGGFEEGAKASTLPVAEGKNETSRMITKLEEIGKLVEFSTKELDYDAQPEVAERLERAEQMIQELWEEMHDLLPDVGGGSKDKGEADAFAQSKYALREAARKTK